MDFDGVKLELKKALQNIMIEETKAWLIRSLLRKRLATWDIYHFAKNQAGIRTIHRHLDWQTMGSALRAKLRDIISSLTHFRRVKSKLECQIRELKPEDDKILKKVMSPWKKTVKEEKGKRLDSFREKVKHYIKKQKLPLKPFTDRGPIATKVPRYLKEYGSLSIFKTSKNFPKKRPPVGPFVGSQQIKLSKDEVGSYLKILSSA